jgi:hypothetical protein
VFALLKPYAPNKQCCGSGTVCFWASRIRFYHQAKIVKNLDSYCSVTALKNVASKSKKQKTLKKCKPGSRD